MELIYLKCIAFGMSFQNVYQTGENAQFYVTQNEHFIKF